MIAIRSFAQQIIYVSIVLVIIELIVPKGNTKKYVYVILSLFLLLNFVSPVINIINDFDMKNAANSVLETISSNTQNTDDINMDDFSEYKIGKITNSLEEKMSGIIEEILVKENIKFKDLKVTLDEDYRVKNLKVYIDNLDISKEQKGDRISSAISKICDEFEMDEKNITIVEEGV